MIGWTHGRARLANPLGAAAWGLLLAASLTGCGKKGPPLAPFVRVPAQVEAVEARRLGDDVFVSFVVPSSNIDKSRPADVRRVEVYAVTTDQPRPPNRLLEGATLVTVVSVEPTGPPGSTPVPPLPLAGVEPPPTQALPVQGDTVTVHERLTAEAYLPKPLVDLRPVRQPRGVTAPVVAPPPPRLQRSYVVVPFAERGRPGPPGTPAVVPLEPGPPAPAEPRIAYTADVLRVEWEPSGGLLGHVLDRQLPLEQLPLEDEDLARRIASASPAGAPLGPVRYNVYRELAPDPLQLPQPMVERPRWQRRAPRPMNLQPVDRLQLDDVVELERERCYTVRAVRANGVESIEGSSSAVACVRPVDTFAPEPPRGVSTVVAEGAISLIWEASPSADVSGYVVLRGAVTDATLLPVTPQPVTETRFVDRAVEAGVRYAYAVVAVDGRVPVPNESLPSERVEETAR